MQSVLLLAAAAFALSLATVRIVASGPLARLVLDIPNDRSLHERPVPRTGGLGLMLAAAALWLALVASGSTGVAGKSALLPLTLPLLTFLLAAVFLVDDVRGLPVRVRLGVQLAAAVAFLWSAGLDLPLLLAPLVALGIVWSVNLYNFMDGSNGLAGGMAVSGFGAYAVAAWAAGSIEIAVAAAIVAGAAGGFLVWNFGRAIIFLGDAGSIPLGFLAAAIGIVGWQRGLWPFWLPPLVFSPFVVDACLTLVHRWRRGERLSQAHKSHYYQRLVRMGWSHRRLALAEYALMLAAAGSALVLRTAGPLVVAVALSGWVAVYAVLALVVDRHWAARGGGP